MLRIRAVVTMALLIVAVYALTPVERKRRWLDKLRELGRALAIALVLYWLYMLAMYFFRAS